MAPKKSSAYYDEDDLDDGYSDYDEEEWWDEDGDYDDEPVVQQPKKPITKQPPKPAPPSNTINKQKHPIAPKPSVPSDIKPFAFDTPSPDDVVLAAQNGRHTTTDTAEHAIKSLSINDNSTKKPSHRPLDQYTPAPALATACTAAETAEQSHSNHKPSLHLIVVGHVDAGKSTLMGRMLYELGLVDDKAIHKAKKEATEAGKGSFAWAWMLDQRPEERSRGVTVDVAMTRFDTKHRSVTLLDAPGHRDFVPNMIAGAAQADAALLVVDGSPGGFESGFAVAKAGSMSGGGQTREHAQLIRSLGIEQAAVVVTKLDTCGFSQQRFDAIKSELEPFLIETCGFKRDKLQWLPAVGPTGDNLTTPPKDPLLQSWYNNSSNQPTVADAIDNFIPTHRLLEKPLRLPIAEAASRGGSGKNVVVVGGKMECGAVIPGDKVLLMPSGDVAVVKSIEKEGHRVHGGHGGLSLARAGDSIDLVLTGIDAHAVRIGDVVCHPDFPCHLTHQFKARIVVLDVTIPLLKGQAVTVHMHTARDSGHISRLIAILDSETGEIIKERPRCLIKGQTAVVEVTTTKEVPMELYSDVKVLGRVALRDGGKTVAVGIVTGIGGGDGSGGV